MPYDIYIIDESDLTISDGQQLDGVTQGTGEHLLGTTITFNTRDWYAVTMEDNDANFSDQDGAQRLVGDQYVDGVLYSDRTQVQAEYELTVTDGTNTWTLIGFNVRNSNPISSSVEGLALVGDTGSYPPVGVPLTVVSTADGPSYAATDYAAPICFTRGTLIETPDGLRRVEDLSPGDLVETLDDGPQPVLWHGVSRFAARDNHAPIVFAPGTLGNVRPLAVSQQHRMLVGGWRVQLTVGEEDVLVPAVAFLGRPGVTRREGPMVEYHHLMFARHQIVLAEGAAVESFLPGPQALETMGGTARRELYRAFPMLRDRPDSYGPMARPEVRGAPARVLLAA